MADSVVFNPKCFRCQKVMGEVSEDEFIALLLSRGGIGFCFDCDDTFAHETMPDLFMDWYPHDSVIFEDAILKLADHERYWFVVDLEPSDARALMHACGLSSSTYLNNSIGVLVLPKWILGLDNGCPKCGQRMYKDSQGVSFCAYCRGLFLDQNDFDDNPGDDSEERFFGDTHYSSDPTLGIEK